ncbi:Nitrogenase-stabilizing/protective protein NifW [Vibrio mediterranei]|uniref:Nitrogenase-stabilizing/protective protein NifW n=1 Tax=Vibrio mediterranei TaxID=689 RepID=A0ABX5DGX6_9VIBR|nr:nitrogenase-stabilizing/protective protein NifW [Vibrio mediterranei]PCD89320.1 nitrogen fixation protein NifW [Vibrio mediterranei]PRQ68318.1 nitrogen fixation protein NifW [Vibrio mediterranei]SBO10967.1 Nitrogenase-stabilizing/protective protein NifW [Vibrio mediterranei]
MSFTDIQSKLAEFAAIEQVFEYFEVEFDSKFVEEYRLPLLKRFNGYLIMQKPEDWFAARRVLRNAYCKVQRGRLDPHTRSACRGCTSCIRR